MKRMLLIFSAAAIFGCAKKITPAGGNAGTTGGGGGTVVTNNAPPPGAAQGSTSNSGTPAILPSENTGSKTPANPASTSSPEVLGQSTFNTKCGRCHGLKVTSDYTADRWVSIMQVMAGKAGLTATEKENVLAYVKANAKR